MNIDWKFWRWKGETELARRQAKLLEEGRFEAEGRAAEAEGRMRAVYQRTPGMVTELEGKRADLERLLALGGIGEEHPVWRVVLSYVDEHERNERLSALGPNLSDADRQYNAGRAGSAFDLACALRDLHYQAQKQVRSMKAEG